MAVITWNGGIAPDESKVPVKSLTPSRWRIFLGLLALIVVAQLISFSLRQVRPPSPPTRLGNPAIFADARAPSLGRNTADVTIYLLSDYACPNCRAMHADLRKLIAEDDNIRIVYRDLPILGERSVRAARLAIASAVIGRHAQFDDELMRRGGPLDEASLRAAATRAGADWSRIEQSLSLHASSIDGLIAETRLKASLLGLNGTPVLIIGPYLVVGRQTRERLEELVRDARGAS